MELKYLWLIFTVFSVFFNCVQPADVDSLTDAKQLAEDELLLNSLPNYATLKSWYERESKKDPSIRAAWRDVQRELKESVLYGKVDASLGSESPVVSDLPDEFDARKTFKKCGRLIGYVLDQGPCRSDSAISVAYTLAAAKCVATNGKYRKHLSAQKLHACTATCNNGGYIWSAAKHLNSSGTTTGGPYKPKMGCVPYEPQPCMHTSQPKGFNLYASKLPNCSSIPSHEYQCPSKCSNSKYKKAFDKDLQRSTAFDWIAISEKAIREEIFKYGSVAAGFACYSDFFQYKSGVYTKKSNSNYLRILKIKLIGWGEENGKKYWLGTNSFGRNWGQKGLFKFERGNNHCYIESLALFVKP